MVNTLPLAEDRLRTNTFERGKHYILNVPNIGSIRLGSELVGRQTSEIDRNMIDG